jgi:hypothetical protein
MAVPAVRPQANVLTLQELNEILGPRVNLQVQGPNVLSVGQVVDGLVNRIEDQAKDTFVLAGGMMVAQGGLVAAVMSISPFIGMAFGGVSFLTGKIVEVITDLIAEKAEWDQENTVFKIGKYVLAVLAAVGAGTLTLVVCGTPLSLMTVGVLALGTIGTLIFKDLVQRGIAFALKNPDPYINYYNPWQATFISRA